MRINLNSEQKELFETLLFFIKLLVFAIPLYIILAFQGVLYPFQEVVSLNVYHMLSFLGLEVVKNGVLLVANGFAFVISEDCTGWKSMLFLVALMLAVPRVEIKKRFTGMTAQEFFAKTLKPFYETGEARSWAHFLPDIITHIAMHKMQLWMYLRLAGAKVDMMTYYGHHPE